MHELEGHGGHGGEHGGRLVIPVSITISILAVLVAAVTLLGHRAHTEEVLLQGKAFNQWAYYQAKNIRLRELQSFHDLLEVVSTEDKAKAGEIKKEYAKEIERYGGDKEDISKEAKDLEQERTCTSGAPTTSTPARVYWNSPLLSVRSPCLPTRNSFGFRASPSASSV
jgi:hypothetical protein